MKAKNIGQALRLLLDEVKLSANRLSKASGVGNSSISLILHGKISEPTAKTIEKLLRGAGKSWVWLDEHLEPIEMPPVAPAKRGPNRRQARAGAATILPAVKIKVKKGR